MTSNQANILSLVKPAIISGLDAIGKSDKLPYVLAHAAHETGLKEGHVTHVNNYTGIKYNKQKLAYDSGIKSPEGNNYAGYDTAESWAKDYLRILSKYKSKPLEATSVTDFAQRLKAAGYYTDSLTNYTNGLLSWMKSLKLIAPVATGGGALLIILVLLLLYKFS